MAIYTVSKPCEGFSDRKYSVVTVGGKKFRVFRTSPLFGDMGHGAIEINGQTYTVYRAKREDGDIGYGVVKIEEKAQKKSFKYYTQKIPDDLYEIVRAWSGLSEKIKSKMRDLLKTHKNE